MASKFQTEVTIPDYGFKTGYQQPNLFMGSCFTENIGNKMAALKYSVDINPFGILYNPVSVVHGLRFLIQEKQFTENDLIKHNGLWHSFYHHGRFSSVDLEATLDTMNNRVKSSAEYLKKASFLFITFGTAWVYEYKATGQTVSNCHKIPDRDFRRFRLTPGEITEEYRQLLTEMWQINTGLKIVFTVSPIRHWKDGAIENQRSKATLVLAIDQLIRGFGTERCNYFPAYEIMMDELRDYRFYDEDMIHLSNSAVSHIWNIFQSALIEESSREISQNVQKIQSALNHRPINMFTVEYLQFLEQSLNRANQLQENFPYIDLTSEIYQISENITETAKGVKTGKSNE